MQALNPASIIVAFAALQAVGLLTAWLTRLSEGSSRQSYCQMVFLLCLLAVGLSTMVAFRLGSGYWLISAANLSVMILAVLCDFRHHVRTA